MGGVMERTGRTHERSGSDELTEREHEATSKDTLKEVSEKEKVARSSDEPHDKPPSPDGSFDENRELKDADPI
jgi:hypothetical protein